MRIVFVRHGLVDDDHVLLLQGLDQARWMGERLKAWKAGPSKVFCSIADRTMMCAEVIAGLLGTTHAHHDLAECWEGNAAQAAIIALRRETGDDCALVVIVTDRVDVEGALIFFKKTEKYQPLGQLPRNIEPMYGYIVNTEARTIEFISHHGE